MRIKIPTWVIDLTLGLGLGCLAVLGGVVTALAVMYLWAVWPV